MACENVVAEVETPLGFARIEATEKAIISLDFVERRKKGSQATTPLLREATRQLEEYFSGKRRDFSVALDPAGTEFRRKVWARLQKIPFGKSETYGGLSVALKRPKAARAIGGACGANPILIFIPCHRVIGAGGKLTGFSSGLWRKEWLLKYESR